MTWTDALRDTLDWIRRRRMAAVEIALILGSGLGALAEQVEDAAEFAYAEIPHFPRPAVEGHRGRLVFGRLEGRGVAVMQGRAHYYEGYGPAEIAFPVRVLRALGAKVLIVTNAAGGLNPAFAPGDLMLITDHINFTGANPLAGPNDPSWGPRFPDMSAAYDAALAALARRVAASTGTSLREGVYVGVSGPSYETPAELRMMAQWGGDAVGMSTVLEVIAARHAGLRVLGLSAISNAATGATAGPVTHDDVVATTSRLEPAFIRLVRGIVASLPP
jgi:purine-nucleoside phosphorylase